MYCTYVLPFPVSVSSDRSVITAKGLERDKYVRRTILELFKTLFQLHTLHSIVWNRTTTINGEEFKNLELVVIYDK
jgi:hypothetical protein